MKAASGIIPPIVTPMCKRDELDRDGLGRLIEHIVEGGAAGIFALGSTGEAPGLSYALRREVIECASAMIGGRIPLLVGITDTSFVESIRLSHVAADFGVDALVVTTPYYFPAGQTELADYVRNLVAELPLPLVLYNMPSLTKVWFEIETLRSLSGLKGVIGVKDSSGDLDYFGDLVTLRKERPDWTIFMGPEHLLVESVRLGGDGGVIGGANVLPGLFVETFDAVRRNDFARAAELQSVIESYQRIYDIGKYASRHIKATKCALSLMGICDDFMTDPFHRFKAPERKRVESILREMNHLQSSIRF